MAAKIDYENPPSPYPNTAGVNAEKWRQITPKHPDTGCGGDLPGGSTADFLAREQRKAAQAAATGLHKGRAGY